MRPPAFYHSHGPLSVFCQSIQEDAPTAELEIAAGEPEYAWENVCPPVLLSAYAGDGS